MKEYDFNENTPPKEIINSVLKIITELLKPYGFKYLKSKSKFIKHDENFNFYLFSKSSRYNQRGLGAEIVICCGITDGKNKISFWNNILSTSNSKKDRLHWIDFYGQENYDKNINLVISIIKSKLLPFYNKFSNINEDLLNEISEYGFSVFDDKQVYDANYKVPVNFLDKFGTIEHLTIAFQNYIDRHELDYVKPNFKKAVELLEEGKEVINNGEKDYAEFVVNKGIKLNFD